MPSGAERRAPFWLLLLGIVALDRVTKMAAESALSDGRLVEVLGEVLRFRLMYNLGAAFGMHVGGASRWVFLAIAIGAVVVLSRLFRETAPGDRLKQYALALVAGGAAGNGLDRIFSARGVIDYIDLGIGTIRFPWLFNIADIAVTFGAVALAIALWREERRTPTDSVATSG